MKTLCNISPLGLFLTSIEIEDADPGPGPSGWLEIEPPADTTAFNVLNEARDGWVQADEPPRAPEPPAPPAKRLVSKSLWLGQLSFPEKMKLAELEARVGAIDWDAAPASAFALKLRYFAAFLSQFSKLGDYIDLADQDVLEGIELFRDLMGMSVERMLELLEFGL